MKLALLGSGQEIKNAYKSLTAKGHTILAVTDKNLHTEFGMAEDGPVLVEDHTQLDYSLVRNVLLLSYAPLIKREWIEKALFMNIHCALLPKFRGMHPIQWAIVNGEKSFGYTLHLVDEGIDSGSIIYQDRIEFKDVPYYGAVRERVAKSILDTLGNALTRYEANKISVPQDDKKASYFTKRLPEDGLVDWTKGAEQTYHLCQAVKPPEMPGAYFYHKDRKIAVADAYVPDIEDYIGPTGKVVCVKGEDVYVKCGYGVLALRSLIVDGVEMPASSVFKVVGISFLPKS